MFSPDFSCPLILWILLAHFRFHLRGFHPLRPTFPDPSVSFHDARYSPNPNHISIVGLASSAFARHYSRNLGWFLFLRLLRCFSSAGSLRWVMYSLIGSLRKVSPFGNPRILRLFAPPRGLSQLVTSFVGSQCQGILLVLLLAWTLSHIFWIWSCMSSQIGCFR